MSRLPALLLTLWALACGTATAAPTATAQVRTEQVRAELLAHSPEGVAPGKPLWLGLKLEHAPHWHTYWKNPGDSGLPTTLSFELPAGFAAGEIAWPTPRPLPVGPLMNFGYDGTLLLPVPVTVPASFSAQSLDVKLHAEWLVCKDVCIPESGDFVLSVPAAAATSVHAALFDAAHAAVPRAVPGVQASARVDGAHLTVQASGLPAAWQGRTLHVLPEGAGVIDNAAKPVARWDGGAWQARVPLSPQRSESPASMVWVLAPADGGPGARVDVPVQGPWPAPAPPAATVHGQGAAAAPDPGTDSPAAAAAPSAAMGLWMALLASFVGGALLNLMPCVFPILSLKVLGFAAHAQDRRALIGGGLAYTAGVVLSFVGLAALLLALRAGGEQIGWGFQLQSPLFVSALALLFALIGLNLSGVFELGSVLPGSWGAARARHPMVDSALTGVLAVAVASPCTAPFMGAALGLAATLPAPQALAVFASLGLGMATPYLAACAWPALARRLPRPGVWMAHFKVSMAFPMFATVVWLVWVLGQQAGIDAVAALLGVLVVAAFTAWAWGSPNLGRRARMGFTAVAALLLAATLAWAWPALSVDTASQSDAGLPAGSAGAAPQAAGTSGGALWQPWSAAGVAAAQAAGHAVFVDFTAAWCVTCQYNKRTTLADAVLLADFRARKVQLMRADWTRRDPAITAELARLGRNGVPVYALYTPGATAPRLLNEILTVRDVQQALAGLP